MRKRGFNMLVRLLAVAILLLLSGCLASGKGPTVYLEYQIENLGNKSRSASLGPHCGTAQVQDDYVEIEREAYKTLGNRRPFLVVEPDFKIKTDSSHFATIGSEGYPLAFPASVDPRIGGASSVIARLDYEDGTIKVDDEPVSLPHTWARTKPGDWHTEFKLSNGPDKVRTFQMGLCM